ncbi:MAG TPA: hypothetical protein VFL41_03260 [Gaiellaceae bacterium]|nr:hypothetical protein [Gaiellaceae bacterium]
MGFFRRERPIHEQLAEEGGLDLEGGAVADEPELETPEEPWGAMSVARALLGPQIAEDLLASHGVPRAREWDAIATAEAPDLPGDTIEFVVLGDGTLFVDLDLPEDALTPIADALEATISPPYRAVARRREGDVWSATAMAVDVVAVPQDIPGDEVVIAVHGEDVRLMVDGEEYEGRIPALESFGQERFESFVLTASRLDTQLWEVTVNAL